LEKRNVDDQLFHRKVSRKGAKAQRNSEKTLRLSAFA
jgi:hypothetical protein